MRYKKLRDWLSWQATLHPISIDLGLERIEQVAQACQLNHVTVPVLTVAGTNGKGSTVAMLDSILRTQSYRVGTYTSPHLIHYNERICVDGKPVADELICQAFNFIDQHRHAASLSFFEFGTLAALYCFKQHKLDCLVLEVGLGGRLDAVNIIDPTVSIITSIGLDHTQWLGEDRNSIAREKAGIMRAHRPVICGDPNPPVAIQEAAHECSAQLHQLGRDFSVQAHEHGCDYRLGDSTLKDVPHPALFGPIQFNNAATALMALHCIEKALPVTRQAIDTGLATTQLRGRFQILSERPCCIVDIAHNPDGARVLAENLRAHHHQGRTVAVFGVFADKDIRGILQALAGSIDHWYLTQPHSSRALSLPRLIEIFKESAIPGGLSSHATVAEAYQQALQDLHEIDRVVVFGSMITVAEAMLAGI